MKDIKCPKCGTTFQVDDSVYASIIEQVRSKEFNEELAARLGEVKEQYKAREQAAIEQYKVREQAAMEQYKAREEAMREQARSREEAVKNKTERDFEKRIADKDMELSSLKNEITKLKGEIQGFDAQKRSALSELESAKTREMFEAVNEKDKKIVELQAELKAGELANEARFTQLREQHSIQLRDKQDEIDRLKDFRLRQSTKMVGENLEQHCSILFEQARSMGLYPDALFEKDNMAVEHTKGDFIFRDYVNGEEYVSVMFEMKNEMDTTATKHRNDDFLDKLDKDRCKKKCEYAVLVSMLEQESELYNAGIVDKSFRYPKMIVIRPQFFLPVLRLITEAAKKGFQERYALMQELESERTRSIDFAKFEDRINRFRTSFNNNVTAAHKKFVQATEGIDKTIEALEKQIKALRDIKANFEASEQKLLKANELADENLTVKKLTHGAPEIRRMIESAREEEE